MANLLIWHHLDPEQSLEDYNSAIEYDITSAKIEGYGFFPAIDLPNPEPLS
jgi:hypothetical protein